MRRVLPLIIAPDDPFPDPRQAGPEGLVALGGELTIARLLDAYQRGIFPWSSEPVTWWSPDPRSIIPIEGTHFSRRLLRRVRQARFEITFNRAFEEVIVECAAPAPGREETWIEPGLVDAYLRLHRSGHAHSVECWIDGQLAGGVYGVAIGGMFAGESMFHNRPDASTLALHALFSELRRCGYVLFDTQQATPHTRSLGAADISRDEYLRRLDAALEIRPARIGRS